MTFRRLFASCAEGAQRWVGQDCALCGTDSGLEVLCSDCLSELPTLPECCPRCALPSPGSTVCGACLQTPPHFDGTVALWRYEFPCDRLVQALKYRARLALAACFAGCFSSRPLPRVDLVVPMPLHKKRLSERGFNQAVEIAGSLARRMDWPLESRGAVRLRHTAPQTGLPYAERARNVHGAFECPLDLRGARVGVVDDVMTTGATLNELARVLKRAGASRVENFVIARTVPEGRSPGKVGVHGGLER
jgi:ComF family protein